MAKITINPMTLDYHSVPTDDNNHMTNPNNSIQMWTLTRLCPYHYERTVLGVFIDAEAALYRLKRLTQMSPADGEEFTLECHDVKTITEERVAFEEYESSKKSDGSKVVGIGA